MNFVTSSHESVGRRRVVSAPVLALTVGFLLAATAISIVSAATSAPTKGRIPEAAFLADGGINEALVPDFVPLWNREGTAYAGYVDKKYVLNPFDAVTVGRAKAPTAPVYADDLETIVGHSVPGKGFVPLGVDAATIPDMPVEFAPAASEAPEVGESQE